MNEDVGTEKQDDYEPDLTPGELAADFSADPEMHAHHHLIRIRDDERFDDDIEELRETMVEHLKRIEELERTVKKLDSLINWDAVVDIVNKLEEEIPFG